MAPAAPAAPIAAVMAALVPEVGNWPHALDTLPIANPWWLSWNKVARIHGNKVIFVKCPTNINKIAS